MEAEILLLVVVVIVFMGGVGIAAHVLLGRLDAPGKTLAEVNRSLKTISGQISTKVRPELEAINRNTRWTQEF